MALDIIPEKPSTFAVWLSATTMVTFVSCCALIGFSIVPLLSGPSYKIFNTGFTGLALGSLLGSAIFSLIPQAFALNGQKDKTYLWKTLIIFFGIYLFYCSERLMRLYFERKSRKRRQRDAEQQLQLKKNRSAANLPSPVGDNDSKQVAGDTLAANNTDAEAMTEISLARESDANNQLPSSNSQDSHTHTHHQHGGALEQRDIITKALRGGSSSKDKASQNSRPVIAPLAWMIIIGDGLHNFIDGLSIGAAFSEKLFLGFSTSIAVIFEELPHELGDFAVLLSSGMTVRQALGWNFLSACTCYLGMIGGILLGDVASSASYVFALAAGMFLYISLVDMMGELNSQLEEVKHSTKEAAQLLIMQNLGILSGIIIIYFLSLTGNG